MKDIISQHQLLCRSAEVLSSDLFDIVIEFVYVCMNKLALCWKCSRNICNFSKYIFIFADLDLRSCWIVFNHVVWEHSSGLLQFSNGEAVMILASVLSGIRIGQTWRDAMLGQSSTTVAATAASCPWATIVDGSSFLLPKAWTFVFCNFSAREMQPLMLSYQVQVRGVKVSYLDKKSDIIGKIQIWKWVQTKWHTIHTSN